MNADQPLVTHADLRELDGLRSMIEDFDSDEATRKVALLDRLIAHAEADKPALPEGWVVRQGGAVHWHQDGRLYNNPDSLVMTWGAEDVERQHRQGALTPLVTAVSLAPEGWHVDEDGEGRPTVWDADDKPLVGKAKNGNPSPIFDVLAALVSAAEAERGESR